MLIRKLLMASLVILLMTLPVLAQETSTEAQPTEQAGPSSTTTAVLLIGLVAVLAVGGFVIRRENAHKEVD